jgi:hypothetical protein
LLLSGLTQPGVLSFEYSIMMKARKLTYVMFYGIWTPWYGCCVPVPRRLRLNHRDTTPREREGGLRLNLYPNWIQALLGSKTRPKLETCNDAVTEEQEACHSPSAPEENDGDYNDEDDIPARKPQPSGKKARRGNVTPKQKLVKDSKPITPKEVTLKLERFEVPPGYFKTATSRFKDEITKKVYDIPPGFAITQDGMFVEDSGEEE